MKRQSLKSQLAAKLLNGTPAPDSVVRAPEHPSARTDKTDKSPSDPLLSVLSVPSEERPDEIWTDPIPLPPNLPEVLPLTEDMLPDGFKLWLTDIQERMQCPLDFPSVSAVINSAAIIGRRIAIRPKRHDDWTVHAVLWGMLVSRPSLLKTPASKEAKKPIDRLEAEAEKVFVESQNAWLAADPIRKAKKDAAQKRIAKLIKDGGDETPEAIAAEMAALDEGAPVARRYIVNDTSVEKLGEILRDNPNGVLVFRDELVGWLRSLDKEGQEVARAFYLERRFPRGRNS